MTWGTCEITKRLERELAVGRPEVEDPEHVETCGSCADLLLVDDCLREAAAATPLPVRIRDGGSLWWRSRVLRRLADRERPRQGRSWSVLAWAAACLPLVGVLFGTSWLWTEGLELLGPVVATLILTGSVLLSAPLLGWLVVFLGEDLLEVG